MKTLKLFSFVFIFLGLSSFVNSQSLQERYIDLPWVDFLPCVGEDGEIAYGTITLHNIWHFNKDGVLTIFHSQPQGGVLIGEETGTIYHTVGVVQEKNKPYLENGVWTYTYVANIFSVGTGKGSVSGKYKALYHITLSPEGEILVEVSKEEYTCQ